ncbi:uncharacterized protein LOC126191216 [Schistocerca cancellata]|uniref:uncharacterized protein LOC126191216 n=1 Tax=Schistocerca cancellata TaxID=274614 RepID=UPI0021175FE8|nr:uncharacterized protein LOC126191216 [Schistocerca cancellata]
MRNLVIFILLFVFGVVFIAAIFEAVVHFNRTGDTAAELHEFETNGSTTVYSVTPNYDGEVTSTEHDGVKFVTNAAKETILDVPPINKQRNFNVRYGGSSRQQTTTKRTTTTTHGRTTQIPNPTTSSGTFMASSGNEVKNREQRLLSSCIPNYIADTEGIIKSPDPYPKDDTCITWDIDVGEGYSIDITVTALDLDGSTGDYLIISPSEDEIAETSNPVFTWYLKTKRHFRILDRGMAFIMFKTFSKANSINHQGFEVHYARYGNATTPSDVTTQPALPTPPANVDESAVVYISLAGGMSVIEEFYNRSIEFRTAVSEMASMYCNETGIRLTAEPSYVNVILNSVNPCQLTWPDSNTCLRIRMTVPVNNTNTSIYELTSRHINDMWNKHATNYLSSFAKEMKVYKPPDGSNFIMWIAVSVGTVVVFSIFLVLIWKIDIFKENNRESKLVQEDDVRRSTLNDILISVPPSFPADKFDPEDHKMVSWNGDIPKDSITSVGVRDTIPKYGPPKGSLGAAFLFQRNTDEEEEEVHYEKIGYDNPAIQLSDEPKLSTVL